MCKVLGSILLMLEADKTQETTVRLNQTVSKTANPGIGKSGVQGHTCPHSQVEANPGDAPGDPVSKILKNQIKTKQNKTQHPGGQGRSALGLWSQLGLYGRQFHPSQGTETLFKNSYSSLHPWPSPGPGFHPPCTFCFTLGVTSYCECKDLAEFLPPPARQGLLSTRRWIKLLLTDPISVNCLPNRWTTCRKETNPPITLGTHTVLCDTSDPLQYRDFA